MTLSGSREGGVRSSSIDRLSSVNMTALARAVTFVAESLAKHAFGFGSQAFDVFEGSLAPDVISMQHWLATVSQSARIDAWMDHQTNPTLVLVEQQLRHSAEQVTVRRFPLQGWRLPLATTMRASVVHSVVFEVAITIGAGVYLFAVMVLIDYFSTGVVDVSGSLRKLIKRRD